MVFGWFVGFAMGYGTSYAVTRFGSSLKIWLKKREAEIEKKLKED